MNPFVEAEAVEAEVEAEVVVVMEAVVEVVMEEVVEVVMVEEDTVTVDAAMVVAVTMEEVMAADGADGADGAVGAGPSMDGLIAEANPVLIIFSKSLNDPPFSQ